MPHSTAIQALEERLASKWANLWAAQDLANSTKQRLRNTLKRFDAADTVIVVSGSLARNEFTLGSDIDWTLLIDGHADPRHYDLLYQISEDVEKIAAKPTGVERTFSTMVFSHDLIHQIGGEDDSNRNTTRRLLLLLESAAVGREDAYLRVVRSILNRYLLEDRGFWKGSEYRLPRFLQNDFARYWRTMTVDFAYKLRTRSGRGWAIRNMKLRMSRKLIYVSGLLACYRCHLDHTREEWRDIASSRDRQEQVVAHLGSVFEKTPLEIVAEVLLRFPHLNAAAGQIFGSYDAFLGILGDQDQRAHLESLTEDRADTDEIYQRARGLSHTFRDGLLLLFFDPQSEMDNLTKNYGVF